MICELCGKSVSNYTNIFIDGNTSNNLKKNLMYACPNCARNFSMGRLMNAAKILNRMGFKYNKKGWTYNNKLVRKDELISYEFLKFKIKELKKEVKYLKHNQ